MISILKLYALTSVTLRGTVMAIPALSHKTKGYPFDLQIVFPNFIFAKKTVDLFLKIFHLVNFHYSGKMRISTLIEIETDSLLDKLSQFYIRTWNANKEIAPVPERRRAVEIEVIKWTQDLPKTPLSEFINNYYSTSVENTDWIGKVKLWKSLRHRKSRTLPQSKGLTQKMKDKYAQNWFEYFDKTEFSSNIRSNFPKFTQSMNQLSFRDIIEEISLRICPACETDLTPYPSDIKYCAHCGYSFSKPEQKFCSNCGLQIRLGSRFCTDCGTKFETKL